MTNLSSRGALFLAAATMYLCATARAEEASTQAPESSDALGEIVVTARQRNERLLDVPVAVTAISGADLDRYSARNLADIAQLAPQVMVAEQASGSGTSFVIRGIGSSTLDTGFDQSVAINVDGVLASRGRSMQQSYFDLAQVEILKGPQALFFGKNTPAGVISMTSANPTKTLSASGTVGYEFYAHEVIGSGYVSGPITDTLGFRFAFQARDMRGWMENLAYPGLAGAEPATGLNILPFDRWGPKQREYLGRLTLAFQPIENLNATFKFTAGESRDNGEGTNGEIVFCPSGKVQNPGEPADPFVQDCNSANGHTTTGRLPSQVLKGVLAVTDGRPYQLYRPIIASLSANWSTDAVKLTSVTGYYRYEDSYFESGFERTVFNLNFGSQVETYRTVSQELRALTTFNSPVNFMVGAYYESGKLDNAQAFRIAPLPADPATGYYFSIAKDGVIDSKTYSTFGQVTAKLRDNLELAGGVRWTREEKDMTQNNTYVHPILAAGFPLTPFTGSYSDDNLSPEATLTWHPTSQSTFYGAYKTGYKSGGFGLPAILSAGTSPSDLEFKAEKVKGGEIGAKGMFLDGRLRINSDVYLYDYSDLQVDVFDGTKITYQILNAGAARAKGVEADARFAASESLHLRAAIGYNKTRYQSFDSPCFGGQTIAEGCDKRLAAGAFTRQDLTGHPTVRAPDWSANAGFTYDMPIRDTLKVGFTGDVTGVSKYFFSETEGPGTIQHGYATIDASIRLFRDDAWAVALMGRNLTNRWIVAGGSDRPNSGSGTGTATGTPADIIGYVNRPRQVLLQFTGKF